MQINIWLTNRSNRAQLKLQLEHEERLHRQRLSKERLEELYVLVGRWFGAMLGDNLHLTLVMKGHTDYNEYFDSVNKLRPSEEVDFNRLEMIIGIYGGEVQVAYDATLEVRNKVNAIRSAHKAAYRRGESGERFLKPFTETQLELDAACKLLKAKIADAARTA